MPHTTKFDINFKGSGVRVGDQSLSQKIDSIPYGIKTPIQVGEGRSGIFKMHFDPISQVDDNLKNLILTNHGERLGNFGYGANLRSLTTELTSQDDFDKIAMERISFAVKQFMPFVELGTFSSNPVTSPWTGVAKSMAKVDITVKFSIPSLRIGERELNISLHCIG
jgi:phage baseplate assembly protein W